MSTAIFSLCYLDGNDASGSSRLERNIKYIRYYRDIRTHLHFDKFILIDNCSSQENIDLLKKEVGFSDIIFIETNEHLARGGTFDYPYVWRGVEFLRGYIEVFDKILCIDSDVFVLSTFIANYINGLKSGWTSFWSSKYRFPTSELHVLCQDAIPLIDRFSKQDNSGQIAELVMPFTLVNRDFIGDRYGEDNLEQKFEWEWMGQVGVNTKVVFNKKWDER